MINKADLNSARADEIVAFCMEQGVEVVGCIPYDTIVTEAMVPGRPVMEHADGRVVQAIHRIWEWVKARMFVGE